MKLTYQKIKDLYPCYDPIKYIPENWEGTVFDILDLEGPSIGDKFWVILREDFIPSSILHEFGYQCAEHVLHFFEREFPNDLMPREAIEAKRKWVRGEITNKELEASKNAAWEAHATAWDVNRDAARNAARYASRSAACAGAWSAKLTARYAAQYAARTIAGDAARTIAGDAEREWQIETLKKLLL